MKTFLVEVARDATIRYRAKVEAESLDEVKRHMRNYGYVGPIKGDWEQHCVNEFDDVEEYVVYDPDNLEILYEEDRR